MVTAIILMNIQRGKNSKISKQLAEIDGITEVFSVGGRYDLVALIRVKTNDQLAELVNESLGVCRV